MALVKCNECGREISDAAPACPQCGRPQSPPSAPPPKRKTPRVTVEFLIFAGIVGGIICLIWLIAMVKNIDSAPDLAEITKAIQTAPSADKETAASVRPADASPPPAVVAGGDYANRASGAARTITLDGDSVTLDAKAVYNLDDQSILALVDRTRLLDRHKCEKVLIAAHAWPGNGYAFKLTCFDNETADNMREYHFDVHANLVGTVDP